ncbi:UNVERIFIED_CONTAM: hypothetical protein GTU68_030359 [Idotea baltica]|nr:hypothetical protein [Idotea baltica]
MLISACDKEEQITDIIQFPRIKVANTSFVENEAALISVALTWPYTSPVTVQYELLDLENKSAEAGVDYIAESGEVVFSPGDTLAQIPVELLDDIISEQDEKFRIQLSDPIYGELLNTEAILTIVNDDNELIVDGSGYDAPENYQGYDRVWEDDFSGNAINASTWSHETGNNGWGNNELQNYTDRRSENARVENGKLVIEAHQEKYATRDYTSARLVSKGKGDWLYGRFVTRAKLASGVGVWSAIWMLSSDNIYKGWPHSGEIDILENVGFDPDSLIGTIHTLKYNHLKGTHKNGGVRLSDAQNVYHEYILEWEENQLRFYVDNLEIFRYDNEGTGAEAWPFDQPFHMILNLAYGGNWGGREGIKPEQLPARMEVDYVRVYQKQKVK